MRLPRLRATEASGDSWDDPDDDKLTALVGDLDAGNRFLVVERHDRASVWQHYLQVYVSDDGAYAVEFREGGPERHFRAHTPDPVRAAKTLVAWASDDPAWKDGLTWQPWDGD
jgi:hypothetical protein